MARPSARRLAHPLGRPAARPPGMSPVNWPWGSYYVLRQLELQIHVSSVRIRMQRRTRPTTLYGTHSAWHIAIQHGAAQHSPRH
eukprot:3367166-Pyramimonas_sp.AAC.1